MNNTKNTKKGGNFSKDLANLSVPFGLILAQKSLEKYLNMKTPSTTTTKAYASKKSVTPKKNTASKKTSKQPSKLKDRKTVV